MRAHAACVLLCCLAACVLSREGQLQEQASAGAGGDGGGEGGTSAGGDFTSAEGGSSAGNGGTSAGGTGAGGQGGSGGGAPSCPVAPGPEMIFVPHPGGDFCIDSTEVTSAQYAVFLLGGPTSPVAACDWKTTFVPRPTGNDCTTLDYAPLALPNRPVTCVDWCDAYAYCAAAGKRLCGAVGGGEVDFDESANAAVDEWYYACSANGTRLFPYGDTYAPTACVGDDFDGVPNDGASDNASNVGSAASCEGGKDGLFDMSGNVWEWENSCSSNGTAQNDDCHDRGGSFWDVADPWLECPTVGPSNHTRAYYNRNIGFRCCADPLR